ncbi:single-stranded-DNA-specific exonuclease RecJ [Intestinicryptomonas porci]|uniref:Single-stranded-DNA-specific exonuclease RecJ n=1 Tax=Intestinicryptomonas porci TaxID=2926320 RepID=A0ABU4WIE8_9BACT|nr:single-stranded-DNA-specific exonuclease RecJ [Opitutales bacterium CLA-KB-P66]
MDWKIGKYDAKLAADLGSYLGVSPILASLLLERGFSDPIRAEMFLKPKLTNLGDPFRVKNLRRAALRLIEAISKNQKVLVFGDYDVDGITSTTLFVNAMRHFDCNPSYFVPRRMDEGYGLSEAALERAFADEKPDLLVALDCGTNAMEAIHYIRSQGIDLIVVDHHQSKDNPAEEDYILVNPHVFDLSTAPWRNLCTVGLVFKLVHALVKEMRLRDDPRSWTLDLKESLDLVSLGTIADLVPLVDENRILARYGIKRLKSTKRKGIQALIQASGISLGDEITPVDISFRLGPRINASGRLADASLPLDMLLGDDFTTCFRAACELNDINKERQEIERGVFESAMKKISDCNLADDPCIIVFDTTWHPGVVGIIAGKLSREFNRPVIVFGETDEGYTKGSGRSIAGLDLVECLSHCTEFLGSWGGHPMAVGVSVKEDKMAEFKAKLNSVIRKRLEEGVSFEPELHVSLELAHEDICFELLDELEILHPFGEGNKEPIFAIREVVLEKPVEVFGGGQNFKFQLPLNNGTWISAVAWRMGRNLPPVNTKIDFAMHLSWNRWNKRKTPQATIVDWRVSSDARF